MSIYINTFHIYVLYLRNHKSITYIIPYLQNMNTQNKLSRRAFLKGTALAAGMVVLPGNMFASLANYKSANDEISLGFIGLGQQAMYLLNGFMQIPGVRVIAGADVYDVKRDRFKKRVTDFYASKNKKSDVKVYERYTDILNRPDIDAVVIATPDHWHAIIATEACKAGKDVYLEKPMTFTIFEGQQLCKAVRKNKSILQVGSQQRSDSNFQHAAALVQSGKLGKISNIKAYVGAPPTPYNLPQETLPSGLNWDLWLGPLPTSIHYNKELNPPVSLSPEQNEAFWGGWRWYKEMGGGFTTDWGAHMFDISQWALNRDKSGPSKIIPAGYNDTKHLTFVYDDGIQITEEQFDGDKKGVKIYGDKGWIQVCRGEYLASDNSFLPPATSQQEGPYETRIPHQTNFIESMRSRKDPVVPVEVGHSSCTVCTLGNIAYELGRPVEWDPKKEKFVNDKEANKLLHYQYRDGYKLS